MRQDKVVGAKYVNLEDNLEPWASVGDILELVEDDGTTCPLFYNLNKEQTCYLFMDFVAMLAEEDEEEVAELPEHKYSIGQKLTVNSNSINSHVYAVGTEVTVIGLEGFFGDSHENGIQKYEVREDGHGFAQYLLETQLDEVVTPHKFAVGDRVKIVATDAEESYATPAEGLHAKVVALENIADESHYKGKITGVPAYLVRTNGGSTQSLTECQLEAVLIQWDNPEVKAGDVIVRENVRNRGETVINRVNRKDDTDLYSFSSLFVSGTFVRNGQQSGVKNWRKATPEEVAELEDAEKKHGVKLPLINNKGTVIEAGSYYVLNADYGHKVIVKVTSVCLSTETFAKSVVSVNLYGEVLGEYPHTTLGSPYGVSAVPATPEQIELYDTAVAFHKAKEQLSA